MPSFQLSSEQLSPSALERLRNQLEERGFLIDHAPHAHFKAQKEGVFCTLYTSGKLVVQGKESASFIEFYLEPEILHNTIHSSEKLFPQIPLIGSDEAGKGDFFGPLCIASCFADLSGLEQLKKWGVRDSKELSDTAVLLLAEKLQRVPHHLIILWPERYNALYEKCHNLNQLLAWAHANAILQLHAKTGATEALVDQFSKRPLVTELVQVKNQAICVRELCAAETLHPAVAAASILARAAFLLGLKRLGNDLETPLPKGAGIKTLEVGKMLLKRGKPVLESVCKQHFKNFTQILAENR